MTNPDAGGWVPLVTYAAIFEADFAAAQLNSAGVPARVDAGEAVGIFGAGFQGPTARGARVLVPGSWLAEARTVLGMESGTA